MKEILKIGLPGFKADYNVEWFDNVDFSNLKNVKQVYGILFNEEGKILIINTVGNWQLPGGKPEEGESWKDALIREVMEEADIEIEQIIPLGHQIVSEIKDEKSGEVFCQLRCLAKISKINELTEDPATGIIPERKFIDSSKFSDYCPWGKIGQHIIDKAKVIFQKEINSNYLAF
jgi:8-oxo-dGTP pyrophosphatase MutT (NUDIX family)